jgi:mannose-6-phosphate isomerase-like protein (cupin superfamily)
MKHRVVSREGSGWAGVPVEGYQPGAPPGVERHTIIGGRKESPESAGPQNELRYFRLWPGKVSRLEKHEHEHYVIVGEGEGYAILGSELREIKTHDVVYVGPLVPHQFVAKGEQPFGFFCTVSATRDFSQVVSPEELEQIKNSPAGAYVQPDGMPRPRYERKEPLKTP